MQTIFLRPDSWDLDIDADGNIATASDPYSQAQDAASSIRTFKGEAYYLVSLGVPYWENILGSRPPLSYMRAEFVAAALLVPGVAAAVCYFSSFVGRKLSGQVQMTNLAEQTVTVGF